MADHFSGDPIIFSEAVAGNCLELSKLTLLLLYITLFTEAKLRTRLVNSASLDQATQAKVSTVLITLHLGWFLDDQSETSKGTNYIKPVLRQDC